MFGDKYHESRLGLDVFLDMLGLHDPYEDYYDDDSDDEEDIFYWLDSWQHFSCNNHYHLYLVTVTIAYSCYSNHLYIHKKYKL